MSPGGCTSTYRQGGEATLLVCSSRFTSFFLYLRPSLRQETALVTAMGGLTCTCIPATCRLSARSAPAKERMREGQSAKLKGKQPRR